MLIRLIIILSFFLNLSAENWEHVNKDLSITRVNLSNSLFGPELLVLKTGLKDFTPVVVRARDFGSEYLTVQQFAYRSSIQIVINANYFDPNRQALGLVMQDGVIKNKLHNGGSTLSGIFYFGRSGFQLTNRTEFNPTTAKEAFQAGPRLLDDGKKIPIKLASDETNRRTALCKDHNSNLLVFVSLGWSGLSLTDLQSEMSKLFCQDAINLDGGGSTQIFISKEIINANEDLFIAGRDPVPVALGLKAIEARR